MAIFGKPRSPFDAPEVYNTPGIGDGINLPQDPRIAQAVSPGFFGKGGTGSKMLVGALGGALDGVARWGGAEPGYANAQRQWQEMQAEQEKVRMMLDARRAQIDAQQAARLQQPSNAARMAQEAGLQPGSPQFQQFVQRYAFQPKFITVGNAQGGEDTVAVDPSGLGQGGGLQPGFAEDGYVYLGGDPASPTSWRKQ